MEVYPPENTGLGEEISNSGAIISELPLRFEPLANTFPARNRIISGLSLGTIVVEARKRSGALITAQLAMEQNREVMAVPGKVDAPGSEGPHKLIKEGAAMVERIEDVMEALGYLGEKLEEHASRAGRKAVALVESRNGPVETLNFNEQEKKVLNIFDGEPLHQDKIIRASGLGAGKVFAILTGLQLKAVVEQLPGGYYKVRK
jgi:DNA processing protein